MVSARAAALAVFLAAGSLQTPEQFLGHKVGADNKLVRWDKAVEYFKLAAANSDRVRYRELGKTSQGNPFVALEIASPETLKNLDRYKQLERKLYFQGGAPTDAERDQIFRDGKLVLVITCSIHATEIGASQMAVELVHRLATEESALVKKILDNVIFVLVPSLNPDGQIMVTDWFTKNVGTPYANSPIPYLYHPYVGHDNNRDMYMFTQKESQHTAQLLWHDWFPSVWLDEHQMGSNGARIFVMPATDPINPNVHPLIYRWNGILGQSQAAALEAAGKEGIIYNSTYTNFWEGAMAWSGWWHNQIGLLTEVASARVAAPIDQQRANPARPAPAAAGPSTLREPQGPEQGRGATGSGRAGGEGGGGRGAQFTDAPLPPPTDINSRTEYPRPWLGGRWTLRDIVDYELIATMALLETAADRREAINRQIYEVNRQTIEDGRKGHPSAILVPVETQHDPREAAHLVDRLHLAGIEIHRANAAFEADGRAYAAGTFVIPMTQVFARYAKDMLEKQTYPEVRRGPNAPPEPPYDVTAWSLGMLLGVDTTFVKDPLPADLKMTRVEFESNGAVHGAAPKDVVTGSGNRFEFDYKGPDTAIAINRLLKDGARAAFVGPSRVAVSNVGRSRVEQAAKEFGLAVKAIESKPANAQSRANPESRIPNPDAMAFHAPRVAMYQPWTGGNMDEGWTRWVLEQYQFNLSSIHNDDIRAGKLRQKFDAIIIADQDPRAIVDGYDAAAIRPEYRGGIGEAGVDSLKQFVADGGSLVMMGSACDLAIERFPIPVRNLKKGLTRDQHFAPGAILRLEVDAQHPMAYGVAPETYGFYINSPFFSVVEGFASQRTTVVARYPNTNVIASGWLKGEELMAGRAAVVAIDMNPGKVVLFGLRPQHRAQTHATFPLLFNALYLSASGDATGRTAPTEP
jgi:hypothetical protein